MKKILALLLALVMVFALAACGGESDPTTSDNSQASDNVIKIGVFEPLTGDFRRGRTVRSTWACSMPSSLTSRPSTS